MANRTYNDWPIPAWLHRTASVTPFSEINITNKKFLTNSSPTCFDWCGKTFFSAEQAFQYARIQVCCSNKTYRDRIASIHYNTIDTESLKQVTEDYLKEDLENSPEEGKLRLEVWYKYRKDIMTSILMAKVKGNPWIVQTLLDTGKSVLANCSGHRYWGCGTTLESEAEYSFAQWVHSMSYNGAENWIPMRNPHNKNHLGKIWMRIRDHLTGEKLLPKAIIVGDTTVRNLTSDLAKVYCWEEGKYENGILLASMLVTPSTECVILHFGTFNIPKYHYSTARYWSDRNRLDGSIQVNNMHDIMSDFVENILKFDANIMSISATITKDQPERHVKLAISDILPRHQDVIRAPMTETIQKPYASEAQQMVSTVNRELRETRRLFPDIQFLEHGNLQDQSLYRITDYCRRCNGVCGESSVEIDHHYNLPLNERGTAELRVNFEYFLTLCGITI